MNKIKKIGSLIVMFLFTLCNVCFADVVMTPEEGRYHGMSRYPNTSNLKSKYIMDYIFIGILILVIIICAIIIITNIVKKKKEKSNNDK